MIAVDERARRECEFRTGQTRNARPGARRFGAANGGATRTNLERTLIRKQRRIRGLAFSGGVARTHVSCSIRAACTPTFAAPRGSQVLASSLEFVPTPQLARRLAERSRVQQLGWACIRPIGEFIRIRRRQRRDVRCFVIQPRRRGLALVPGNDAVLRHQ